MDTRFLALAEDGATEIENSFIDLDEADLPPGATIEEYDEDGFRGARIRLPFAASDDVNDAINAALSDAGADLSGELSGLGPTNLFERFDLLRDDGGWRFAAVVAPFQETLSSGDGDILGDDILDSGLVELLLEDFEFTIRLDLPGDIVEHNADAVDGSALIWNLDPFSQEPRELMALTSGGGGTNSPESNNRGRGRAADRGYNRHHLAQVTQKERNRRLTASAPCNRLEAMGRCRRSTYGSDRISASFAEPLYRPGSAPLFWSSRRL